MDEHAVELLLSSIDQGDSPLVAMQALLSDDDAQLLALACVPRRIDASVLGLLGVESDGALARIRALGVATPVPGPSAEYVLADTIRAYHYKRRWSPRPGHAADPRLADLSRRLSAFYADAGKPLEALYHRFPVDPDGALQEFQRLYDEADERFELPRCRDLLDVLEQRLPELPPSALALWDAHRAYVNARGLWVDDWYRSARFLVPQASRDPIEALLAGVPGRSLQLWAAGGLGKTTHIRWLIARRCIPQPERIACARVDFDMIVAAAAVEEPWLVLLELAEQLNAQLRETPFARLLKQFGEHRERLRLASEPAHVLALPDSRRGDAAHHDEVRSGFRTCLAALAPDERVVVVLDTLEVPLLIGLRPEGRSPLHGLLRDLAVAYAAAPSLRVVFAGRLDLRERVEDFATMFADCQTLSLTGFSEAESRRYLEEHRGLADDAIVAAAARAADGTPFKLALIADVIEQRPDLDAADIERYADVDLLYLIKRVVERIEDPLTRWVLRYGVIPRTLDRTFVAQVMVRFVEQAASRGRDDDRPADDDLPDRDHDDEQPWVTGVLTPGTALDPDDLWNRLLMYAGGASWVNVEHTAGREVLRFHPDVLNPMRRLLAGKDVFAKLQRAACDYFERRARAEPASARWQTYAVFHRFHLDGVHAASYWRGLVRAAAGPEHAVRRRQLAEDLLAGDYTDDDGNPLELREGVPLIAPETLQQARFELAWAITQHARDERRPQTSSHWSQAWALMRRLAEPPADGVAVLDADRYALALGTLHFSTGSLEDARRHVDRALRSRLDHVDRLWLVSEYADALAAGGRSAAAEARYRQALELGGPDWPGRDAIVSRLVRLACDQDRLAEALDWAREALDAAGTAAPAGLRILLADAQLRSGQAALALETVGDVEGAGAEDRARGELMRARAALQAWQPLLALRLADDVIARLADEAGRPTRGPLVAEGTELRGAASAALLDVQGAMGAFGETAEQWRVIDDSDGVCRTYLRRAEFLAHDLGDVAAADLELSYAEKMGLRAAGERSRLSLLRAELVGWHGDRDAAARLVASELASMRERDARPHELAAAALTGLAVEEGDASELLRRLCDALAAITPPARRLALVRPLRRCGSSAGWPPELRERLRGLVPSASDGDLAPLRTLDAAILTIADADLDRTLGRTASAQRKLRQVAGSVGDAGGAGLREWLEAWHRAGGDTADVAAGSQLARVLADTSVRPLQRAAISILVALGCSREGSRPLPVAEELLRGATAMLACERSAGRWPALLQEGLAQVARRRAQHDRARDHVLLAADVYERLGDGVARERVLAETGATPAREGPRDGSLTIALHAGPGVVDVELATGGRVRRIRGAADNRVIRALFGGSEDVTQFSPRSAEIVAGELSSLAKDLADVILGRDAAASQLDALATGEIRLRILDLALHHVPWELALVCDERFRALGDSGRPRLRTTLDELLGSEEVREVQRALAARLPRSLAPDGILGPDSRAALEEFQRAAGLRVTGEPDPETEHRLLAAGGVRRGIVVRAAAGPEARGSLDLRQTREPVEWIYRRHGFEMEVVGGLTLAGLRTLSALRPPLIHLSGAFVEYEGTAVLDLAGEWEYVESRRGSGESERISPRALARALLAADSRPIVILDPPAPRGAYELGLQLMLRNAFAGDLFAHGGVRAVLGLGLTRHEAQEEQYELVVRRLAEAVTLGSLVRGVHDMSRSRAVRGTTPELAFASAVLFARTGEIRPPWSG